MQNNKILIAAGTLALSVAGFLSSHANSKKFLAATSVYFTRATVVITLFKGATISAANNFMTTTFVASHTCQIKTGSAGTITKMWAVKNSGTGAVSKTIFVRH